MKKARLTKWNGKKMMNQVVTQEGRRLTKAAIHFTNKVKQNISTKGSKCNRNNGRRSRPGEYPFIECGQLRNSITYQIKQLKATCGTNVKHGKFMELGTKNMAPRPWLRSTLKAEKRSIKRIIAGKKLQGF